MQLELGGEPVDAPPEAAADDGQDDAVDAVRGEEEEAERQLQGREGDVCGDEEGRRGAGGEDGVPDVRGEGCHCRLLV